MLSALSSPQLHSMNKKRIHLKAKTPISANPTPRKQNHKTLAMADTTPQPQPQSQDEDQYGVLLYYKYAQITDLDSLFSFYESNCNSLSLLGRVRLSPHGVNVTVRTVLRSLFTFSMYEFSVMLIKMGF